MWVSRIEEVVECASEPFGFILEESEGSVAVMAKEAADFPGGMVVIDAELISALDS